MKKWNFCLIFQALGLALTGPAVAASSVFSTDLSNTIYSEGAFSNGAGDFMFAGNTLAPNTRRALMRFDVSGLAGATITSVTLQLTMDKTTSGATTVSLHRLTRDWGQGASDAPSNEGAGTAAQAGDATWLEAFYPGGGADSWASPGGDFDSTASAQTSVAGNANYQWSSAGLIADVQSWVDGGTDNDGWILIGDEGSSGTAKRFQKTGVSAPSLTVEYTMVPEPATAMLSWVAVAGLALYRRRSA